ncbi:hypothetical protein [Sharpea azabuensis]|uniref:hypothetical protein n=1 Tax=Sharpea azabuensis TaxID=322505 RepID=UPI0013DB1BD2|nr:hypothetical protein [Sharpea azabuensis]
MVKNRSELKHRAIYLNQLVAFQKIVLTLHKLIDDDIEGIVIKDIWIVLLNKGNICQERNLHKYMYIPFFFMYEKEFD